MMRRWRLGPGVLLCVAAAVWLGACSRGEDVPLVAPGGGTEWPADPNWRSGSVFGYGTHIRSGIWDPASSLDDPRVVLVGNGGEVYGRRGGRWARETSGVADDLTTVIATGPDAYLAVGEAGAVCAGTAGRWQVEDAGVQVNLRAATAAGPVAWVVGDGGTACRREEGLWNVLPSAGSTDLVGAAAGQDSLFVAAGEAGLRVWAGTQWSTIAGPWQASDVVGVQVDGAGQLYVVADVLYLRSPSGWTVAVNTSFSYHGQVELLATGRILWWEKWGDWERYDPDAPPEEAVEYVGDGVLVPRARDHYLDCEGGPALLWSKDGERHLDPQAYLMGAEPLALQNGGGLFWTSLGVMQCGTGVYTLQIPREDMLLLDARGFVAGAGQGPDDYYLAAAGGLYHCVDGQPALAGTWAQDVYPRTLAIGAENVLFAGTGDGILEWRAGAWVRGPQPGGDLGADHSVEVRPSGQGGIVAVDNQGQWYLRHEGRWLSLGLFPSGTHVVTAADGTTIAVGPMDATSTFEGGNALRIFDPRAGGFRDLGSGGMGPVRTLGLAGALSRDGEILFWTRNPSLVCSLVGPPQARDWRILAGPHNEWFRQVERLPDGRLIALLQEWGRHATYQP